MPACSAIPDNSHHPQWNVPFVEDEDQKSPAAGTASGEGTNAGARPQHAEHLATDGVGRDEARRRPPGRQPSINPVSP
jgi:hypothetical protein